MIVLNVGCGIAMNWIQKNKKLIQTFARDGRYLVAVSGGRDSIALLRALVDAGYGNLIVCHLDHQLRGRSSDAAARFVRKIASDYRLNFQLAATDVRALAGKKRMSIETAAREARYSFFAKIAKRNRCKTIFLAHHADDLVETFLINLFRGAGLTGLAAIREVSMRTVDGTDLTLVRPLLGVWRSEIDKYIRQLHLNFREDASNRNLLPLRNRVRRKIIPELEKILGRNIRQNIWRTAMIAAEEESWIENQLPDFSSPELAAQGLRALPAALQRRRIRKWLRGQKVSDVGFDAIERVRSLADSDARIAKVNLARDRHARRRAGKIFVE